jgi:hypothetical protein
MAATAADPALFSQYVPITAAIHTQNNAMSPT